VTPVGNSEIEFRWGVKIPLRDGIHLNATLYLPKVQREPGPCVLVLTPYIADTQHERAIYFATHGWPFVVVDVRGRGNSEGTFRPMIQEAQDGFDVVEWLARQSYCNGQVAMCGGSYLGYAQWATAKEMPPHLAALVPAAAPYQGVDFPMRNNIFNPYLVQWILVTSGQTSQATIFCDGALWSGLFRRWFESGKSFRRLDTVAGVPSAAFHEWLDHPALDDYWDKYNPTAEQYAQINLPILTITGSYDDDQPGALEHYKQHMRYASHEGCAQHYLVIGSWAHAGMGWAPSQEFGGLRFAPQSTPDLRKLHLEWYQWTLLNGPKPIFLQKPVAYYVMGAERWQYADTLEAVTERHEPCYLDSSRNATDIYHSGWLGSAPGRGQPDFYTYDPRDVTGPEVAAEANATVGSLVDQTMVVALNGRQLVYHSAPFERDTEVSGFFKLRAWIAIDCPDTDLYVTVYEMGSDGGSIRLSTDGIRARYREGPRIPNVIRTHEPWQYDFERFTFVSRQIKKGHRLRLVIAPMGRLIETTFSEKNYNSGGVVAEESAENARPVTVRLFHDEAHPSVLHVPLGQSESHMGTPVFWVQTSL
jgi:putative CocE/NonD family hydrolase